MRRLPIALVVLALACTLLAVPAIAQADPADDKAFSDQLWVENRTFYPLVKDGYRDHAVVGFGVSGSYSDVEAAVYNSAGAPIRVLRPDRNDYDELVFPWNGKKTDGTLARKGEYRIDLTAVGYKRDESGEWVEVPVSASRTVTLAGGLMDRRLVQWKRGVDTATRSRGPGCYTDAFRRTLELACWRGTSAKATWRFKVPSNATKVRKYAVGLSGWDHGGRFTLTVERPNRTTLVVTARVTKWRQEFFDSVGVWYTARVRV